MKHNDDYIVTVAIPTYNHGLYIEEGLKSVLAQKTSFPYKILIFDDGSFDDTCEIVRSYVKTYPNIELRAGAHVGMVPNFIRLLRACQSRYIALCDGDDFWIDDYKLQKQYDFMESHPDFSACGTQSWVLDAETGKKIIAKTQVWDTGDTTEILAHRDNDNIQMSPFHTSTYFFRNGLIKEYPTWWTVGDKWMNGDVMMTDFPLYMLISRYGKAKFINDITAVYRHRVDGGSSIGFSPERATKRRIWIYENINKEFKYKYKQIINPIIGEYYWGLSKYLYKNKSKVEAIFAILKVVYYNPTILVSYFMSKR